MSQLTRTPLGRVRGLGSARSGTEHFWRLRLTSLALVPLSVIFLAAVVALTGADHARAAGALSSLWLAIPMMLVVIVSAIHMRLGMQVFIEDYVHTPLTKYLLLMANTAFSAVIGLVGVLALVILVLGD